MIWEERSDSKNGEGEEKEEDTTQEEERGKDSERNEMIVTKNE